MVTSAELVDKRELNPYLINCPTRKILDRVGDRWTVLVIGALSGKTKRFSVLLRDIEGISQKMLTQTLKALERDGLLTRTAYLEVPIKVEYKLTEAGSSLLKPLRALEEWSIAHFGDVQRSQKEYDIQNDVSLPLI